MKKLLFILLLTIATSGFPQFLPGTVLTAAALNAALAQKANVNASTGTGLTVLNNSPVLSGVVTAPIVIGTLQQSPFYSFVTPPGPTQVFYIANGLTQIYTANATNNWVLNLSYSPGVSFNSQVINGNLVQVNCLVTNGSTAYYQIALQIDGVTVTPLWNTGFAPTSGDPNSVDMYTYTILKTGATSYSVFASANQYQ